MRALCKQVIAGHERAEGFLARRDFFQPKSDYLAFSRGNVDLIDGRGLCSDTCRVNGVLVTVNDVFVDRVFYEWRRVRNAPEPFRVAFVLRKNKLIGVFAIESVIAKKIVARL